jgi:hypothetical protein
MTAHTGADCVVVDTNVLAVAEGLHTAASDECRASCIRLANKIHAGLPVAVDSTDSGEAILREYLSTLKKSKTSGVGRKRAIHLWSRRHDGTVCRRVDITRDGDSGESFEEVLDNLKDFDNDDHKWIAVALIEETKPQIFQALDGEWWRRRKDFVEAGVDVQFLCVTDLVDRT